MAGWKNIMKAYPFEESRLAKWQPPYFVQPKYDGIRCRALPTENGKYILVSSEENIIYSCPHIQDELARLGLNVELDGELYTHGMQFEQICSYTLRQTPHEYSEDIQFHVFDLVTEGSQTERLHNLISMNLYSNHIVTAPFWIANNLIDIMEIYNSLIRGGFEGIIVRNREFPYEAKRSLGVMKFKPKKSDSYKIVGFKEEHTINGQPKDRLGSFICDSGDGNTFDVGTGFNAQDRELYWKNRDSLLNKWVKVGYQNTTAKGFPRFPVFYKIIGG